MSSDTGEIYRSARCPTLVPRPQWGLSSLAQPPRGHGSLVWPRSASHRAAATLAASGGAAAASDRAATASGGAATASGGAAAASSGAAVASGEAMATSRGDWRPRMASHGVAAAAGLDYRRAQRPRVTSKRLQLRVGCGAQ